MRRVADWLGARGVAVFAERAVVASEFPDLHPFVPEEGDDAESGGASDGRTTTQRAAAAASVDFCVTLGGDGTVLRLASLFGRDAPLPPVVALAMGSLGFLTPFDAGRAEDVLASVLAATDGGGDGGRPPVYCTLRTRRACRVLAPDGTPTGPPRLVLNECLIDRGASPAMVTLDVAVDGAPVTRVEADGVIVATPSGSTAYSLSVGGSLVAPSVPCTLVTPVAPHSLSFRPVILPEAAAIELTLARGSRAATGRVSFDGRHPTRLPRGGVVRVTTAACALPFVTQGALDADWTAGLVSKLGWATSIRPDPARRRSGGGRGGGRT
jgi:NAD+ kinase